jgi:hypothetical protein
MKMELTDAHWLHEHSEITLEELAVLAGVPPDLLHELVDHGALAPIDEPAHAMSQPAQWRFTADCIVAVRTVGRLREDFDLDANALSVALSLIERIRHLEARLQGLQSQFPGWRQS